MEAEKQTMKGGLGAADYVSGVIGGIGQQTALPGSNVIAPKVGGSPLSPAVYGGKKSKKQQKKQSKTEKKVDGGEEGREAREEGREAGEEGRRRKEARREAREEGREEGRETRVIC